MYAVMMTARVPSLESGTKRLRIGDLIEWWQIVVGQLQHRIQFLLSHEAEPRFCANTAMDSFNGARVVGWQNPLVLGKWTSGKHAVLCLVTVRSKVRLDTLETLKPVPIGKTQSRIVGRLLKAALEDAREHTVPW